MLIYVGIHKCCLFLLASPQTAGTCDRTITQLDQDIIEEFFTSYKPEKLEDNFLPQLPDTIKTDAERIAQQKEEDDAKEIYLESVIDAMKTQLMLNSATKEEVEARKKRWRELTIELRGATAWSGFSEVFMVSSATGEGIDALRVSCFGLSSSNCCYCLKIYHDTADRIGCKSPMITKLLRHTHD